MADTEGAVVITRAFDAPQETLWSAWTDPDRFKHWYGPRGHTIPSCTMDVRKGGTYLYCMRGPDGGDFWATGTYRELDPPRRLVLTEVTADEEGNIVPMSHYGHGPDQPMELVLEVALQETDGGGTRMTLRATGLPPGPMSEGAKAGWEQALGKLADRLDGEATRPGAAEANGRSRVPPDRPEIVLTRVLHAPRQRVFDAFTDAGVLGRWWGPNGFTTTTKHFGFRPGGTWDFVMHGPDGTDHPNYIEFQEVVEPERIVYDNRSSADHPGGFRNTLTLEDHAQGTLLTMRMQFPTAQERDRTVESGAVEGGEQTLGRLARLVEEVPGGGRTA